ncbi:hypothetical protein [Pseudoalteromonas ruthenica]|uniref:Uncharacterized protein n=1 Tax=Pseudoalteromonas ruthenica TaxID=151081 RepID=A0A0F4Q470_9GAMM|nr:hypothetical protein [Pseudoalteromonas ruthenica]KJY98980.1 hypothetical protein TW76_04675 [Pseudoalteromonas ruthenica]KJZ01362.1 hypothetical protein TW72_03515 [Pseudoalteromonas ruthenica]TMO89781.1 hypothetical protein CWC12_02605 [Pseudoalteromonas ruthenica]TMO91709.1 hypothetical protein CWC13_13950 [Pseudoalteromonas ruthenica]TMO99246.1 hypothetical protein CWC07_09025 [Pseudoalteromonas ruthenica]
MSTKFSIYDSPFSDETKVLRRNSLLLSGICLFIGLTGELPSKLALLGVSFDTSQQSTIGWFFLAILVYFYLHFISNAAVEVAKWIHPFLKTISAKKIMLTSYSHAFDEEDFVNIPNQVDEGDKNDMQADALSTADWQVKNKLSLLYKMIYLKLTIEILIPICVGLWAMVLMFLLITS